MFSKAAVIFLVLNIFIFSQNSQSFKEEYFKKISSLHKIEYPGDSTIDIKYYGLKLKVTYQPDYLIGSVTIKAAPYQSPLNSFFLDLQDQMNVDSIISDNQKVQFTHSNAKVNIILSKTYNPGEEFEITIFYRGLPGASGFGSFEFQTHGNDQPAIWTLSEPYGASDWFPCKDTPGDKADSSDVWITIPDSLYGVSNGDLIGIEKNSDGTATYKWTNKYPIAQYLISLAIANYTIYKSTFIYDNGAKQDSMPVINYIYPENLAGYKSNLDKVPNMIRVMSNEFGQYPFIKEKYGNAEMGWQGGGGMEHQTVSSMSSFAELVLLHELVHQWYGDKITCRNWQNIWLNEGFATYGEALYTEAISGESAYKDYVLGLMQRARNAKGSIYVQNINSISEIFNGDRSYAKGGIVLHMLRGIVGDSTFFRIMKAYAGDPALAYGTAVTEDFQRVAQNVSGKDLNYFFKEWIYGENYPKYKVDWSAALQNNNRYEITMNISQTANTNPSFFIMPMQVKINTNSGDTLLSFMNDMKEQQVKFLVRGDPSLLTIDPDNWILKEALTFSDSNENTKVPISFDLKQNYPNPLNPFNPTTTIKYQVPEYGTIRNVPVKVLIYDVLGNLVDILVNEAKPPGKYSVIFSAANHASGVYFYRLIAGPYVATKKLVLLK